MKKTLVGTLALLAGAVAVHAQGSVALGNYGTLTGSLNYLYVTYKATGTELGGASTGPTATLNNYNNAAVLADGNDWTVALYGAVGSGLSSGALSPTGATATFANGVTDATAGTWVTVSVAQIGTATTYAGTVATIQLVAWYNEGGAITSLATALADGVPTGQSATANISLGGPQNPTVGGPPATAPKLPDSLGNFSVAGVPEPSTIALGVIGASAFLMRLRRKS